MGLIELHGHSKAVLYKGLKHLVILFNDDECGEVVCKIPFWCELYEQINPKKKYHLQASLFGSKVTNRYGMRMHRNNLIVNGILKGGENE